MHRCIEIWGQTWTMHFHMSAWVVLFLFFRMLSSSLHLLNAFCLSMRVACEQSTTERKWLKFNLSPHSKIIRVRLVTAIHSKPLLHRKCLYAAIAACTKCAGARYRHKCTRLMASKIEKWEKIAKTLLLLPTVSLASIAHFQTECKEWFSVECVSAERPICCTNNGYICCQCPLERDKVTHCAVRWIEQTWTCI